MEPHNEPSHLDLCCLTFRRSTLLINFFPRDNLLKLKADDKCRLKFDSERINTCNSLYIPNLTNNKVICKLHNVQRSKEEVTKNCFLVKMPENLLNVSSPLNMNFVVHTHCTQILKFDFSHSLLRYRINSFGARFQTTFVVFFFFYFNKPSLGKTFICKVERLNFKQRRSR